MGFPDFFVYSHLMKKFLKDAVDSAASVAKVVMMSRRSRKPMPVDQTREIVILGNGPSLRQTMEKDRDYLMSRSRMAVNFAALTEEFRELRPDYYIMIDALMFPVLSPDEDSRAGHLWCCLREVDWPMVLFVPVARMDAARKLLGDNRNVTLSPLNLTPVEGWRWLTHAIFRRGMGMPRPRNVLVAAVMAAIWEGFGRILLAGADHTWSHTMRVDSQNRICMAVEHFYSEDHAKEDMQVAEAYRGVHIHDVYQSLSIAFRSYFHIKEYADSRGVRIVNISPVSMIDAFPRGEFPDPFFEPG